MSDDEIYLACLLAIGPWDWKVEQTEFLMDQLNRSLGRKASLDEGMKFINGYRRYSRPLPPEKEPVEKLIDTHSVGPS